MGSKTQQSMLGIVDDETIAVGQGSITDTPIMLHYTHEVGLAVTHPTTSKSQIPSSASRVGAALIVCVSEVKVGEVAAQVNLEYIVEFAVDDGADLTNMLTVLAQIIVPLPTAVVTLSKNGAKVFEFLDAPT